MDEAGSPRAQRSATLGGLAALAIWSLSVALMRGLSESIGMLTGPALASLLGGLTSLAYLRLRGGSPAAMLRLPARYLWGCGSLFVITNVSLYLAIGWCTQRPQVLVIGLINYLWPALTVALSVPILGRKASPVLPLACLLAVAGTAVAMLGGGEIAGSDAAFWLSPRGLGAVAMALATAVSWGLYSNLARRWGSQEQGAVPLFVLATAASLGLLRWLRPEVSHWTLRGILELCTLGVASLTAAYALWDWGMRRGRHSLLGLCSYFVPVASTLISCVYLGVRPGVHVLVGTALVAAGALASSWCLDGGP
ncbi:MAG: EamA family transporter [Elusimicrobia bacterium]|nr:EamA family transporter [Elusimicrobiota bacterium]